MTRVTATYPFNDITIMPGRVHISGESHEVFAGLFVLPAPVSFSGRRHQFIDSHHPETLAESKSTFTVHPFSTNFMRDMLTSDMFKREHFGSKNTEDAQGQHLQKYFNIASTMPFYLKDLSSIKCQI